MKINCDMIKDLLPLYIDEKCSSDAVDAVEKHIKKCEECRHTLELMRDEQVKLKVGKDTKAKKPFKKVVRVTAWSCFGVVCVSFLLCVFGWAGFFKPIYDRYYCSMSARIEASEATDEWQTAAIRYFSGSDNGENPEQKAYLEYDSIFAKKRVSGMFPDSFGSVDIRILDEDGNVVVEPTQVCSLGEQGYIDIDELKTNTKYTVQYKCSEPGTYPLQFE